MRSLLLCFLLLAAGAASAAAPSSLQEQARAKGLARAPYWLALLHYAGSASEIRSPDFFLSPSGARDPQAELAATLDALFAARGDLPDEHAQCRFVARYQWLRRQLDWSGNEPPAVDCAKYRAYSANGTVRSVSVIYATGYMSNPASFYGHILVKFNTERATPGSNLLEQSLNFGADVPRGENPVAYVVRGLFGGYDAAFSNVQFFSLNHAYAENELRDLWEYVLALEAQEVDALVAHSWELLGKKFDYYFLKENCAFRMAQLLELVIGRKLLPDLPWSIPATLFDRLTAIERHGVPLVREVRRIPSRQSVFRERYAALSGAQRAAVAEVAEHEADFSRPPYASLGTAEKIAVADTLLDYYEYRIVSDRKDALLEPAKRRVLVERIRLPARSAAADAGAAPSATQQPPHEGPLPFRLGAGPMHNSHRGDGLALRLRPSSYDTLSLDAGRIPSSTLAVFDLSAVAFDGSVQLRRFDVFNVENLNVAATPLDGGMAWKLRAGVEAQDLACQHCGVAKVEGGLGVARALSGTTTGFLMLEAHAQSRYADSGWLAATPRVGIIGSAIPGWKTSLSVGQRVYLKGERPSERVFRWENRIGGRRNWDLRLAFEQHVAREASALLSIYW